MLEALYIASLFLSNPSIYRFVKMFTLGHPSMSITAKKEWLHPWLDFKMLSFNFPLFIGFKGYSGGWQCFSLKIRKYLHMKFNICKCNGWVSPVLFVPCLDSHTDKSCTENYMYDILVSRFVFTWTWAEKWQVSLSFATSLGAQNCPKWKYALGVYITVCLFVYLCTGRYVT